MLIGIDFIFVFLPLACFLSEASVSPIIILLIYDAMSSRVNHEKIRDKSCNEISGNISNRFDKILTEIRFEMNYRKIC